MGCREETAKLLLRATFQRPEDEKNAANPLLLHSNGRQWIYA